MSQPSPFRIGIVVVFVSMTPWLHPLLAAPLNPNETQFKISNPKYQATRPDYLVPGNVIFTLEIDNIGLMLGTTISKVYRDPQTQHLTFEYQVKTYNSLPGVQAIQAANVGGAGWTNLTISNVGADGSGFSGTSDPSPEWIDGDPEEIHRSNLSGPGGAGQSPQWRFLSSDVVGTVIGYNNESSRIWFETTAQFVTTDYVGYIGTGASGFASVLVPSSAPDTDVDGILDSTDNCPTIPNADQANADADHVGNACDACPNTSAGTTVNSRGCPVTPGDADRDSDVDYADYQIFQTCITGPAIGPVNGSCTRFDFDQDGDVDQGDFATFQRCISGPGQVASANCAD